MRIRTGIALIFLAAFAFVAAEDGDSSESVIEQLVVETLVSWVKFFFYLKTRGRLMDGKVIDTSLSREPLVVELGKRSVITGLEQALVGLCEGQKIKATIPAHLAYGKRGYPPTIPGDSTLEFEVEVISLSQQTPWQKIVNDILPLLCLALVPTLLGLVGLYLYNKARAQPQGKKKSKDKKSKKK
uniref:peptidylprolyl isomerase n=1 Tax=Cyprinus carpio TaxID=7962 RepID=A0A8C2GP24_CYPCA